MTSSKQLMAAALFALLISPANTYANTHVNTIKTGLDLQNACGVKDGGKTLAEINSFTACIFFMKGAQSMHEFYGLADIPNLYCLPDGVTVSQAIKVVVKWLNENPDKLHIAAIFAAIAAQSEAFPCDTGG